MIRWGKDCLTNLISHRSAKRIGKETATSSRKQGPLVSAWQHFLTRWAKSSVTDWSCISVANGTCFTRLLRSLNQKWVAKIQAVPEFYKASLHTCLPYLWLRATHAFSSLPLLTFKSPMSSWLPPCPCPSLFYSTCFSSSISLQYIRCNYNYVYVIIMI